jgi:4-amino-4-deoxy-L-arabinose transferase-like glycosyltransferase
MNGEQKMRVQQLANIRTVLILFIVLGAAYGLATPTFEKPDEQWHLAYIKRLIDGQGYPAAPIVMSDGTPAQESSQPPFYYTLAALAVRVIAPDLSDLHTRLTRNPAFPVEAREARNDNKNVFVHAAIEGFPFEGTARAVQVARLVALLFGALTVYATYRLGLEIFPEERSVALLAASVVAFLPQFIFISSAASNDSTAAALCALTLWAAVRVLRQGFTPWRMLGVGLTLGLAALSKASAIGLWPIVLLALALFKTDWQPKFGRRVLWAAGAALIALALTGPWLIRTALVFGDVLGTSTHLAMPWARTEALPLGTALSQIPGALNSWWLAFGWGNIVAPGWIYGVLDALLLAGLMGAGYWFITARGRRVQRWSIMILAAWLIVIVVAFIRWIQLLDAALGRLLFPAIGAAAILIAVGWTALLKRWAGVPVLGLLILSIAALPLWLAPAYARPALLTESELAQQPGQSIDVRYGDVARLVWIALPRAPWPRPGDEPVLRLCWQPLRRDTRPLLVLTQIIGAENRVITTRRTLPGLGAYPMSVWQPGGFFCDVVRLPLPANTPAPGLYQVEVSVIDAHTRERLPAFAADGSELTTNFVGPVKVTTAAHITPPIEHGLSHRLGDQFELIGYGVDRSAVPPGETIRLKLYWSALRQPDADYTVFAQVRAADNQIVAQQDGPPQAGTYPTSFWEAGEVVIDDRVIEIPANAPSGTFPIKIGLYRPGDGVRLMIDGDPAATEITLPIGIEVR